MSELHDDSVISGPNLSSRKTGFLNTAFERLESTNTASTDVSNIQAQQTFRDFDCFTTINLKKQPMKVSDVAESEITIEKPHYPKYIGSFPIKCKLLKQAKEICCLRLDEVCEHRAHIIKTSDYIWHNKCIILAAEQATNGLFNFLLPLRAKARSTSRFKPIVLLLRNKL